VKAYLWHWRVSGERRGGRGGGGIRRRRRRNDSTRSGLGVGVSLILRRVLEEGKKLGGDRPQTPSRSGEGASTLFLPLLSCYSRERRKTGD